MTKRAFITKAEREIVLGLRAVGKLNREIVSITHLSEQSIARIVKVAQAAGDPRGAPRPKGVKFNPEAVITAATSPNHYSYFESLPSGFRKNLKPRGRVGLNRSNFEIDQEDIGW